MPRTQIDFHQKREDAIAALSSLREVGLNRGDVGGAWPAEGSGSSDDASGTQIPAPRMTVQVADVGAVELTGWLVDLAQGVAHAGSPTSVSRLFEGEIADASEAARIQALLQAGGGIVGVRARDAFNPDID